MTDKYKEKAEKLWRTLISCMNCETEHAYKPGNERCHEIQHIAQALRDAVSEERERIFKLAIETVQSPILCNDLAEEAIRAQREEGGKK